MSYSKHDLVSRWPLRTMTWSYSTRLQAPARIHSLFWTMQPNQCVITSGRVQFQADYAVWPTGFTHLNLLVGPYAVAHLRLSRRLADAGVSDRPAKVYLTDALESPNQLPDFTASLLQERLTQERSEALEVKKDLRVLVCLGNPPYDREQRDPDDDEGRRKGGWVRFGDEGQVEAPILEDFLAPVREAGQGGQLKNLYNDYVYFWRWALWKVLDSAGDSGIVTFITASSYLRGPGFAGMRRKMREVFDDLWIVDLEGDSHGARKTDNVFAIRTPVAIAIGVRDGQPNPETPARVWKKRLTGPEKSKLAALENATSFGDIEWRKMLRRLGCAILPGGIRHILRLADDHGRFPVAAHWFSIEKNLANWCNQGSINQALERPRAAPDEQTPHRVQGNKG